jgi:hypothetical protein
VRRTTSGERKGTLSFTSSPFSFADLDFGDELKPRGARRAASSIASIGRGDAQRPGQHTSPPSVTSSTALHQTAEGAAQDTLADPTFDPETASAGCTAASACGGAGGGAVYPPAAASQHGPHTSVDAAAGPALATHSSAGERTGTVMLLPSASFAAFTAPAAGALRWAGSGSGDIARRAESPRVRLVTRSLSLMLYCSRAPSNLSQWAAGGLRGAGE